MRTRGWIVGLYLAGSTPGCIPAPRPQLVLTDPDPSVKIPAIRKAVRERDMDSARQLVKELDSDDPAVRFYAIGALRRLTGETYNYIYYDDQERRAPALRRWQQWLEGQDAN